MIITSCPLRISLFGGSTDNPYFVKQYGYGSVISFTCDLKTYVTLSQDKFGFNKDQHKYIINYSRREEVSTINEIQNDVVRVVLEHFNIHQFKSLLLVMHILKVVVLPLHLPILLVSLKHVVFS